MAKTDKQYMNWGGECKAIRDLLTLLERTNDEHKEERDRVKKMRKHMNNVFEADLDLDSKTTRTNLIRSHICRTVVEVGKGKIQFPDYDINPLTDNNARGKDVLLQREKSSIAKGVIEFYVRKAGMEAVFKEAKEDMLGMGDAYIRPSIRKIGKGKYMPYMENFGKEDVMIDADSSYLTTESWSKKAGISCLPLVYTASKLAARYGQWILDYVKIGSPLDDNRDIERTAYTDEDLYTVFEVQDITNGGMEVHLVGGTSFPVLWRGRLDEDKEQPHENCVWEEEYKYKDEAGEPICTLTNLFCYHNPDSPYNYGLVHKTVNLQITDEILQNLKVDNMILRLDITPMILGGNKDRVREALDEYYEEKEDDRRAILHIPGGLNERSVPTTGTFKFDGVPSEDAETVISTNNDVVKNATGITPERQEKQTNTSLGEVEILEENQTESIEDIVDDNTTNIINLLRVCLFFTIAHKGFGLTDVQIPYTKYYDEPTETEFPDGVPSSMNLVAAAEAIKGFSMDISIDRSSAIKRSRAKENRNLIEVLNLLNPQVTPEWFKAITEQVASNNRVMLPETSTAAVQQTTATGGNSQFQSATEDFQELPFPT